MNWPVEQVQRVLNNFAADKTTKTGCQHSLGLLQGGSS